MQLVLLSQPGGEGTAEPLRGPKDLPQSRTPAGFLTQDLHLSCASVHDQFTFESGRDLPVLIPYISPLLPSPRLCHFFRIATNLYFSYTSSVDSYTHSKDVYLPKTPT